MRLSIALLLGFILACSGSSGDDEKGKDKDDKGPPADPRTLVEVAEVAPGTVGDHVVASAAVESEAQAALVPETSGIVTGIYAEEGDAVSKGQLLAVIASPQLDAAYERASAELERTTAEAESAERLFQQGAIARTELDVAQRALAAARTAHQEASQTRGFTRLESPIKGVVATRNIRFGETAGPTPAFTIVDPGQLRVVVSLPERDLARVSVGQPATVVSAYDEAVTASGQVLRVAPVVDTQTGTVRVTVALDPSQSVLRPGQYVSVRIEVARHDGVLTVPRRAVVWEEGRAYVYTLLEGPPPEEEGKEKEEPAPKEEKSAWSFNFGADDEEEEEPEIPGPYRRAHRVAVSLGYEDGVLAEVIEGVAAGEQVVTVGNQALRDDARVRLPTDPVMAKATEAAEAEPKPEGG